MKSSPPRKLLVFAVMCLAGCRSGHHPQFDSPTPPGPYELVATQIEYPDIDSVRTAEWDAIPAPQSLENPRELEPWPLTLDAAVRVALENSQVIRTLGGAIVQLPTLQSVFGPAIAETDPRASVEGALSDFDAQLGVQLFLAKQERATNQTFSTLFPLARVQNTGQFVVDLSKVTATGSQFSLRHHIAYDRNNTPPTAILFPSSYTGDFETEWRQPLLQGAGVEFNRIAGPNASPGAYNGVLLARINQDVSLTEFEVGVVSLVSDVETAYWELYFAYRNLETRIAARDSALVTWQNIAERARLGLRGGEPANEAQARSQYFIFHNEVQTALGGLNGLYAREQQLRLLMGLPPNGPKLIRPADEPTTAKLVFPWSRALQESYDRRAELRRQKWEIQRHELELVAARNFLLPRLDAVALYRWNGLGDDLLRSANPDPFTSLYQSINTGDYQEWQVGLEFSVPLGQRRAFLAVRNAQLKLARSRAVLEEQERYVSHRLSDAVRNLELAYGVIETNFNRRVAAYYEVEAVRARFEERFLEFSDLLLAQRRLAEATSEYYRNVVDYNLALRDVHQEKGTLLDYDGVLLTEGGWSPEAARDAYRRGQQFTDRLLDYRLERPLPISRGPLPPASREVDVAEPLPEVEGQLDPAARPDDGPRDGQGEQSGP